MPAGPAESQVLEEEIDEAYEPTQAEITEYANWLGMDLAADQALLWLAREGLKAPLPPDWKPCKSPEGEIYYFNFTSGESVWDHPCDDYYRNLLKEERRKLEVAKAEKKERRRKQEQVKAEAAAAPAPGAGQPRPRSAPRDLGSVKGPGTADVARPSTSGGFGEIRERSKQPLERVAAKAEPASSSGLRPPVASSLNKHAPLKKQSQTTAQAAGDMRHDPFGSKPSSGKSSKAASSSFAAAEVSGTELKKLEATIEAEYAAKGAILEMELAQEREADEAAWAAEASGDSDTGVSALERELRKKVAEDEAQVANAKQEIEDLTDTKATEAHSEAAALQERAAASVGTECELQDKLDAELQAMRAEFVDDKRREIDAARSVSAVNRNSRLDRARKAAKDEADMKLVAGQPWAEVRQDATAAIAQAEHERVVAQKAKDACVRSMAKAAAGESADELAELRKQHAKITAASVERRKQKLSQQRETKLQIDNMEADTAGTIQQKMLQMQLESGKELKAKVADARKAEEERVRKDHGGKQAQIVSDEASAIRAAGRQKNHAAIEQRKQELAHALSADVAALQGRKRQELEASLQSRREEQASYRQPVKGSLAEQQREAEQRLATLRSRHEEQLSARLAAMDVEKARKTVLEIELMASKHAQTLSANQRVADNVRRTRATQQRQALADTKQAIREEVDLAEQAAEQQLDGPRYSPVRQARASDGWSLLCAGTLIRAYQQDGARLQVRIRRANADGDSSRAEHETQIRVARARNESDEQQQASLQAGHSYAVAAARKVHETKMRRMSDDMADVENEQPAAPTSSAALSELRRTLDREFRDWQAIASTARAASAPTTAESATISALEQAIDLAQSKTLELESRQPAAHAWHTKMQQLRDDRKHTSKQADTMRALVSSTNQEKSSVQREIEKTRAKRRRVLEGAASDGWAGAQAFAASPTSPGASDIPSLFSSLLPLEESAMSSIMPSPLGLDTTATLSGESLEDERAQLERAEQLVGMQEVDLNKRREKLGEVRRAWEHDLQTAQSYGGGGSGVALLGGVQGLVSQQEQHMAHETKQIRSVKQFIALRRDKLEILEDGGLGAAAAVGSSVSPRSSAVEALTRIESELGSVLCAFRAA